MATLTARLPHVRWSAGWSGRDAHPHAGDATLKELAAQALDAARAAGATYADVRFTLTRQEEIRVRDVDLYSVGTPPDEEQAAVGVRALVDGAWGFAAGPIWSTDEVTRLGRTAAQQAKINAIGRRMTIELGDRPPVVTGDWVMPVAIDPFTVPLAEKLDVMWAYHAEAKRTYCPDAIILMDHLAVRHRRQEKTFASTDGSFVSQTRYLTHPFMNIAAGNALVMAPRRSFDRFQPTAGGWEVMTDGTLMRDLPRVAEDAVMMLKAERVQPNRYDIILDGYTVGQILARTVGMAAELDRALGYEANAGGTSYLAPPAEILGTFSYGSPMVNVTADRSRPGSLATVHWDDEGVVPETYPVVTDGVLVDYHTTRGLVSTLAPWYGKSGKPLRSHGCASSQHANAMTLVQPPNLTLAPAPTDTSFDEMVANLESGLVVFGGTRAPAKLEEIPTASSVTLDRQQLNGEIDGNFAYEVKKGKIVRIVSGVECLFRAPELWKSLQALGGKSTQVTTGCTMVKGQPVQELHYSVTAVPARFRQVAVTDRLRKA